MAIGEAAIGEAAIGEAAIGEPAMSAAAAAEATRRENLAGAALMGAAMALFAVEDALIKAAATAYPVGQVLLGFGIGGAIGFALLLRLRGEAALDRRAVSKLMAVRMSFEIVGRLFYSLAIALTPLSSATVILQATPLLVMLGAALFFAEPVGARRWIAVMIGLLGVGIILQPGAEDFSALSLLAVIGTIGFAGRDLASRAAPASISSAALGFYGFIAVILAGAVFSAWEGVFVWEARLEGLLAILAAATIGVAAYSCLTQAMRTGEVSAVAPLRYSRLLFGVGLGVALFGEEIAAATWLGGAMIVISGIVALAPVERRRRSLE